MTNRQTYRLAMKIREHPDISQHFKFKEHDSYCFHSSFSQGGCHAR